MTRRRTLVFLLLLCAFIISFLILTFDLLGGDKSAEVYKVSLIVRGKNSERWESIKQGADQAAGERNVDLSFITLAAENSLTEQLSLLQRELDGGADAIVLSAANSDALTAAAGRIALKVPVVCIESPISGNAAVSYISADNYAMGVQLGQEIVISGNARKRLAIVESSLACENVRQRRAGLMSVLEEIGGEVVLWNIPDDPVGAAEMLTEKLMEKKVDVVVTLDVNALEWTAQVVTDLHANYLDLFGIGSTGKVASYIEQDIVTATVVQNDFGIGYLGVKAAVDSIQKKPVNPLSLVEHRVINWENMYEIENQRLLFPFIR